MNAAKIIGQIEAYWMPNQGTVSWIYYQLTVQSSLFDSDDRAFACESSNYTGLDGGLDCLRDVVYPNRLADLIDDVSVVVGYFILRVRVVVGRGNGERVKTTL